MSTQELREAQNEVTVEGILIENKLETKVSREGKNYISGDLLVEVAPDNIVPVNFFSFQMKKDGQPNRIYASLENVANTYQSAAKHGRENADKIRITGGRIEANEFYNAAGQLISTFRIRSNFVNKVSGEFAPKAVFQVETYVQSIVEEVKDDVPTDRLIIKGVVPMYGGRISVLDFYVKDPNGVKYVQSNYSAGDTVKLAGVLDNEVVKVSKTEEMEFGDDIIETFTRIKRELIVTKGKKPYEDQNPDKFETALVKQALVQREVDLKTEKERKEAEATKANTDFGADDVPF